jgi:hypothetical protein
MRRRRGMGGEEDDQSGEKLDLFSLIHGCRNPPPCISTASLLFSQFPGTGGFIWK